MFFIQVWFYKILMVGLKAAIKLIPQPQPVIFTGQHSSLALVDLIINQNVKRVLIVTDKMLYQLGLTDTICQKLVENNIEVIVFDQVIPDPSDSIIDKGITMAKNNNCDLVLGIGGGSSLDAAKMIAVLATTRKTVKNVAGLLKIKAQGLPLYLLPTTSGTGSEVTMAAVITSSQSEEKLLVISPKILPIGTALDPMLMQGMPANITADTGFDALTHAIEAYLSTHANEQTNLYSLTAIKLICKQLPIAYKEGNNIAAREALAVASCYAGLAFTKAGLGYVHAISHQIGAKYHLPHGMTNAIILPHVLTFNKESSRTRLAQLAKAIGLDGVNKSELAMAELFIDKIKDLQRTLNIKETIACLCVDDIDDLAKAALKEAHYLYPVPQYLNLVQCKKLFQQLMPS